MKALAKLFAGRFLAMARRALPAGTPIPWVKAGTKWVVYTKPVVQGSDAVLRYLGRYIHRTAITDAAVVATTSSSVTFRYRDSTTHRLETMTLPGDEFLRRFLQHVLPRGLHRVRSYGLLHPRHRRTLQRLRLVLGADTEPEPEEAPRRLRCPRCHHGSLVTTKRLTPAECERLPLRTSLARAPPTRAQPAWRSA